MSLGKIADAEKAVEVFHQRLDNQRYAEIYEDAYARFKQTTGREAAIESFRSIRMKYGTFVSGTAISRKSNTTNGFTVVDLTFESEFTKAAVIETFQFVMDGDVPRLTLYHIKAN